MAKKKGQRDTIKRAKEELLASLDANMGIVTTACSEVKIGRSTFYRWLEKDKKFKAEVEKISEDQKVVVESKLLDAIRAGNIAATIFYLKCRHKGYRPKQTIGFDHEQGDKVLDRFKEILK